MQKVDEEEDVDDSTTPFPVAMLPRCRIEWIGGGQGLSVHDESARQVFHRFIMYGEGTTEDVVKGRHRYADYTAMRRISISTYTSINAARP